VFRYAQKKFIDMDAHSIVIFPYKAILVVVNVQAFRWAIDNDMWQARANSIKPLFEGEIPCIFYWNSLASSFKFGLGPLNK
jgi:hypothetical protein